ncbi:MAG: pyridoxal-phosphate dependent enzyme [Chloroflexi bacterium]|nr:pyridoxal-phosphate dependent enzyme [Chloroflexota bacterium]
MTTTQPDGHAPGSVDPGAPITPDDILRLRPHIDPVFLDAPTMTHPGLDAALGCRVTLQLETLNPIRSFKGRGTEALLSVLPPDVRGVVATSTGNFGQGLARAATRRGVATTIVCPAVTSAPKVAAMRRLGATVVVAEPADGNGKTVARRIAEEQGLLLIEDGAHPEIAAGAGTIGQELTDAGHRPEVLLIQVGDGALASGVGGWFRDRSPDTHIIGVVASRAPSLARSLAAGRDVPAPIETIAEGIAVGHPVAGAVARLGRVLDEVLLVDDDVMVDAMRLLLDAAGVVAEPAGAAGIAAIRTWPERFRGLEVVSIITGSNVPPGLLGG